MAGTWNAVGTLRSASGGECVGPLFQSELIGSTNPFTLTVTQSGAALTATSIHAGGLTCSWRGTAGGTTAAFSTTTCNVTTVPGLRCANGAMRDIQFTSDTLALTVSGNVATGTEIQQYSVFIANTRTSVGTMTVNADLRMTR